MFHHLIVGYEIDDNGMECEIRPYTQYVDSLPENPDPCAIYFIN